MPSSTKASIYLTPSKRRRLSPAPKQHATTHSAKELWSWTFREDAFAPCSIKDALNMEENSCENYDFFWLGSVPCRTVKVVGMVVGVQVYEKRIIYTIDDGTGVIDCSHTQHIPKVSLKPETKYKMPEKPAAPVDPIPIAKVGEFIRISGRLRAVHDSRQIIVDSEGIMLCSPNDELLHAKTVHNLHRTSYSRTGPFIIPQPTFTTPTKNIAPSTPFTSRSSPQSSVSSSPIKFESPVKQTPSNSSPIKLRHPSRLHTRDLTENTFRIYMKYYMDHEALTEAPDNDSDVGTSHPLAQTLLTPTKHTQIDNTPRQRSYCDSTPRRPRIEPLSYGNTAPPTSSRTFTTSSQFETKSVRTGFSLSYLRRVPELSLLGSRVVEAVSRRRLRDERKKMTEAGVKVFRNQDAKALSAITPANFAAKMKRLFQWAIVELLKEGSLVLWDGPVRRCPVGDDVGHTSRLWKANTSSSTIGCTSSSTLPTIAPNSILSLLSELADDDEAGALSDPEPNEEAYVPLTPEYLAEFVENAIKVLVDHYERIGKPYAGATKEGILSVLRKDDRWKYVGDWNVDDALEFLKRECRVWSMGKGRWDLTG